MPITTEEELEEESTPKDTCDNCGSECDREREGYWAEGHDNVCEECYYELTHECTICQERIQNSEVSSFILCKAEFVQAGRLPRPPGIYFTLNQRFYSPAMIGSGDVSMESLLFIDRLPKADDHYELSGRICRQCARPYGKIFSDIYTIPKAEVLAFKRQHGFRHSDWTCYYTSYKAEAGPAREKTHTRKVILTHPEMLHDLELDEQDEDYQELREAFDLPPIRMHHDWLVLEYQGVKLYDLYSKPTRDIDISWMTFRPEPRFRTHYKPHFDPGELPTYRYIHDDYEHPRPNSNLQAARAIFTAIKLGILRQDGIHKKKIKPLTRKRWRKVKRQIDRDIFKQFPQLHYYRHHKPKTNKPISTRYCHA